MFHQNLEYCDIILTNLFGKRHFLFTSCHLRNLLTTRKHEDYEKTSSFLKTEARGSLVSGNMRSLCHLLTRAKQPLTINQSQCLSEEQYY